MGNCDSKINNPCKTYPNAKCVVYSGVNLDCIEATTNERLDSILSKINDKLCSIGTGVYLSEGTNISITGNGTEFNPYVINSTFSGWDINGNSNTTSANFLGTTTVNPLLFKVNNIQAGFITCRPEPTSAGSGSVTLGQYAGQVLGTNNGANTLIGHGAGANIIFNPSKANQNTFIGLWAGYKTMYHSDPFGGRSVLVGQSAGFWNYDGSSLAALGCFALEMNNRGNNLTAIGRDALRSNIDGHYGTAVGSLSSLYNTTGIKTIAVTNGGSGYTSATVTISSPPGPTPGVAWGIATATATISSGQITAITIVDPGAGYSMNYAVDNTRHPAITVTISGDGTGATASVTEVYSATGNTSLGYASGYLNKYGSYNIEVGYLTTLNTWGDYNILMGYSAGAGTGAPIILTNAIAIGKNAKVSANNTMALGATGADAINVGINTETARKKLDVVGGDILVHEHTIGRGPGSVATNTVFGTGVATSSTSAFGNVFMGYQVAANGVVSSANVAIGYRAFNTASYAGTGNVIIGYEAAYLDHANESVAIGLRAMYNQGSNGSIAIGSHALYSNVRWPSASRQLNTAIGDYSMYNYSGAGILQVNTAYGGYAGYGLTAGSYNTAIGALSMGRGWSGVGTAGATGSFNTALGHAALYYQNDSSGNIGIGYGAFNGSSFAPTIGYNIAIGYDAGTFMTTGNYNVLLGGYSGADYATLSNYMVFSDGQGNQRFNVNNSGKMRIFSYGTGTHTGTATYNLSVDTNGNVIETAVSSGSYTFENGLTELLGNVHLGGFLIENTTIDGSENIYDMIFANVDSFAIQDTTSFDINTLASTTNGMSIRGKIAIKGAMSPAQITSDQDNYSPVDLNLHSILRISSDASRTITGLDIGYEGRIIYIFNIGANNIVLSNENASSTATNRFKIGSDITITPDRGVQLWYDTTSSRWRAVTI